MIFLLFRENTAPRACLALSRLKDIYCLYNQPSSFVKIVIEFWRRLISVINNGK